MERRPVHYGNTNCGHCWNLGKPHRGCYPAHPVHRPEATVDDKVNEDVIVVGEEVAEVEKVIAEVVYESGLADKA